MKSAFKKGHLEAEFFTPDPQTYLARMGRDYTYVDNLFLKVFAVVVKRDIVILPVHPESALVNKEFTWVFHGCIF